MKYIRNFSKMNGNDFYSYELDVELKQCIDEGLDLDSETLNLFDKLIKKENCQSKETEADVLFDRICNTPVKKDFQYYEPDDWNDIKNEITVIPASGYDNIEDRIAGAWYGRIAGCLSGKTLEGIRTEELNVLLKNTDNYPMHRFVTKADCKNDVTKNFEYSIRDKVTADSIDKAPSDDDTNYMVLAKNLVKNKGRDFTPDDVIENWVNSQPKSSYFTAERVAYLNYINGYFYPASAKYKNKYREYIGARIRTDFYAYINPGDTYKAVESAFRDACCSHSKNGIYGAMYCNAMIAAAAYADSVENIVKTGINYIPKKSRLAKSINTIVNMYENGKSFDDCINYIRSNYDDKTGYGWCHIIPNDCIVTTALLYGNGDYMKSVCLAVQCAYDTDCNGATVGSILGMYLGKSNIDENIFKPLNGKLETEIVSYGTVEIDEMVADTLNMID